MSVKKQLNCLDLHIYLLLQASIQKNIFVSLAHGARVLGSPQALEIDEEISGKLELSARKAFGGRFRKSFSRAAQLR